MAITKDMFPYILPNSVTWWWINEIWRFANSKCMWKKNVSILPMKWLLPSVSCVRNEKLPRNLGIMPVKLLLSNSSICKFLSDANSLGIEPSKIY